VEFVLYSRAHHEAVERLNAKLAEAGSEWHVPHLERPSDAEQLPVWDESFVAVEGNEVYGGYILKHRQFYLEGRPFELGALAHPLSLGEVDSRFAHVSVALFFDAIRRSPYLYSLGLGSEETKYARLLSAAGWQHRTVPFYFSVKAANRFAREIRLPADKANLQKVLRLLGRARLAGAALGVRRLSSRARGGSNPVASVPASESPTFDAWADEVFASDLDSYILVADRRAPVMRHLYPAEKRPYLRLAVMRDNEVIGWALALDTQMENDKYFGALRVGSIADCFSAPSDAPLVVKAADDFLSTRGVDIVVSNQFHPQWCDALEAAGYERGPSNFFFYFSAELAQRLGTIAEWENGVHLNRGDGEGPGHLL
jgi:hypothetical protein